MMINRDILEKPDKEHHSWLQYEEFDRVRDYTITIVEWADFY